MQLAAVDHVDTGRLLVRKCSLRRTPLSVQHVFSRERSCLDLALERLEPAGHAMSPDNGCRIRGNRSCSRCSTHRRQLRSHALVLGCCSRLFVQTACRTPALGIVVSRALLKSQPGGRRFHRSVAAERAEIAPARCGLPSTVVSDPAQTGNYPYR
jgi:hypothetical protein